MINDNDDGLQISNYKEYSLTFEAWQLMVRDKTQKNRENFNKFIEFKKIPCGSISKIFDEQFYKSQFPPNFIDVNPFFHYMQTGWKMDAKPHILFDNSYIRSLSKKEDQNVPPLLTYLRDENIFSPCVLFDAEIFIDNSEVNITKKKDAFDVFLDDWGGRAFSKWFNFKFYQMRVPEVGVGKVNPLIHYMLTPFHDRKDPNPMFQRLWYANHYMQDVDNEDPFIYYIREGISLGTPPNPFAEKDLRIRSKKLGMSMELLGRYIEATI